MSITSIRFLICALERLWMQRAPPKAPRGPKSLKRKRPPPKVNGKKAVKAATAKRARVEKAAAPSKGKSKAKVSAPESPTNRHSRAAKSQANLKLDAQAKELEELNRQAVALARGEAGLRTSSRRQSSPLKNTSSTRSLGTRTSARLRGSEDDEEWQAVPEEWLHEDSGPSTRRSKRKAPSDSGSVSDLTELTDSDDSDSDAEEDEEDEEEPEATDVEEAEDEPMDANEESSQLPADFVEWETVCKLVQDSIICLLLHVALRHHLRLGEHRSTLGKCDALYREGLSQDVNEKHCPDNRRGAQSRHSSLAHCDPS